jgi:hypothetical protein
MVLHRMFDFVMLGGAGQRLMTIGRIIMVAVVAGNIVGLVGNIAASAHYERVALLLISASRDAADNNTESARQNRADAFAADERAFLVSSVQFFCEAAVLLLIVATFTVAGAASILRVRKISEVIPGLSGEAASAAMVAGTHLRRQVFVTTAVVFVTFLMRAIHSTLYVVVFIQDCFATSSQLLCYQFV